MLERPVRVVGWNIRHGGGRRVEGIARQLEAWSADVVALSEYRRTAPGVALASRLAEAGLAFQRATAPPFERDNGLLVASRWPLRAVGVRGPQPEAGRWVLVRVAGPPEVGAFALGAMHAPNRVTGRKYPYLDAVLGLARRWRGGPAVFLGDTNSGRIGMDEESPAFNRREDGWVAGLASAGWADSFRHVHGPEARAYSWYSPNGHNGFRLDQAFVHRSLLGRVASVRYEWGLDGAALEVPARREALSDHAAVILELAPPA